MSGVIKRLVLETSFDADDVVVGMLTEQFKSVGIDADFSGADKVSVNWHHGNFDRRTLDVKAEGGDSVSLIRESEGVTIVSFESPGRGVSLTTTFLFGATEVYDGKKTDRQDAQPIMRARIAEIVTDSQGLILGVLGRN